MHLHRGENIIHRVLKREDLQGNPVESYPFSIMEKPVSCIVYEYLLDSFPADISLDELPVNDLSKIDLSKRSFDVNRYFEKKLEQQKDQLPVAKLKKFSKTHRFSLQYNSGTDTIQSLQILSRPAPHNLSKNNLTPGHS